MTELSNNQELFFKLINQKQNIIDAMKNETNEIQCNKLRSYMHATNYHLTKFVKTHINNPLYKDMIFKFQNLLDPINPGDFITKQ